MMKQYCGALALAFLGCGGSAAREPLATPEYEARVAQPPETTPAEALPSKVEPKVLPKREGLPDDAPLVVATLALKDCDLSRGVFDVERSCASYLAWKKAMPSMRSKGDEQSAIDVSLLRLLRSSDGRIRRAAAFSLERAGMQFKFDADLADVLLSAAEEERDESTARTLGNHVAHLQLDLPGVFERVKKLATSHPVLALRVEVANHVLFGSQMLKVQEPKKVYDFVAGLLGDPAPEVRAAAVSAFWVGAVAEFAEQTCELWKKSAEDPVEEVAAAALDLLVRKPCLADHPWALAAIERRIAAKKPYVKDTYILAALARDSKASEANRARARKLQEKLRSLPR